MVAITVVHCPHRSKRGQPHWGDIVTVQMETGPVLEVDPETRTTRIPERIKHFRMGLNNTLTPVSRGDW